MRQMSTLHWEYGTVTKLFAAGAHSRPGVKAEVMGENGKVYLLRDNSLSPENTHQLFRAGDRVKFEDRQGWPMDLRKV